MPDSLADQLVSAAAGATIVIKVMGGKAIFSREVSELQSASAD
jgi:hypothetical protein